MRSNETALRCEGESCAVSARRILCGDVDSTNKRSTPRTTPGTRTSATATRTTGTRTTKPAFSPSADYYDSDITYEELIVAWLDCRRNKRNKRSALEFERYAERNLYELWLDLNNRTYRPAQSITFVITRPKAREVWAAMFRDRIVQHVVYNRIGPQFERSFIADSCACIKGRGTLYAAKRLESKIRSITENWKKPAFYLKIDLANFFVSISKPILLELLLAKVSEPFWRWLTEVVVMHDPREDFEYHGDPTLIEKVPPHKRLMNHGADFGLAIGNLISQFCANVLLNELDQFVKHRLKVKRYIRYVDDAVILDESPQRLNEILAEIRAFLPRIGVRLNDSKTILQPIDRGVDFVGQVIKPWRRETRRRTFNEALRRVAQAPTEGVHQMANSYFGLLRQASANHHDRARLANVVRDQGHAVDAAFTKTYRGNA